MTTEKQHFAAKLVAWYELNKRELPWRETCDPYTIWLSEIILQQTRVKQGLPYFRRFVEAYPDVYALAQASENEVLRLWQGLGYYSRARNLHRCAQEIIKNYNGQFPEDYAGLIKLKGIGPYTAAAIASFAYNETVPVVDGNVFRVLSRVFGVKEDILSSSGQKAFRYLAGQLVPEGSANVYNQAIMEFGALQCTPKSPSCLLCPISQMCYAYQHNLQPSLPVRVKKVKVKKRYFSYLVFRQGKRLWMRQRQHKDIWQGLYDFHLVETSQQIDDIEDLPTDQTMLPLSKDGVSVEMSGLYKHQLTHQQLWVRFFTINVSDTILANSLSNSQILKAYSFEEVKELPKPILIDNYLSGVIF